MEKMIQYFVSSIIVISGFCGLLVAVMGPLSDISNREKMAMFICGLLAACLSFVGVQRVFSSKYFHAAVVLLVQWGLIYFNFN
jgi:hypothetical protein